MIAWLIGLPVLAVVVGGVGLQLRRRPRGALRMLKVINVVLMAGAGVLVFLAASASPGAAATATASATASYGGQALRGSADRHASR
ncbi:MAG: hypothetical protein ACYCS4_12705 [Acidimicrobiales bacterium]